MLSLSGSLLNSSLGKCSQWPDFGFHYKNFLLTPFSFDQNKDGVEEEGLESKTGFCCTELGVSFFKLGLWESVQVRAVSGSLMGRGMCYTSCL